MIRKIGIAVLSLIFCLNLTAQDNGQLKLLQDKFNSLKNISAGFIESVNGKTTLAGKFYYEKENKLRFELKNLTVVTDGSTTWNFNRKENKLIISSYNDNDPSLLSIKNIVDVYPSKCKVSTSNEGGAGVLTFTPKESGLSFKSVKLWMTGDNMISKMIIDNNNNQEIKIKFSDYKTDQKLPGSLFTIVPPKGSKVIDLR